MLVVKLGMGISEAMVSVWATVWVQHNAPADAKARWLGFAGTSAGIGSGIGSGVASLWSPIYAFYAQALCLGLAWFVLIAVPQETFGLGSAGSANEEEADLHPDRENENPVRFLYEWVGHAITHHRVVFIESVRLPGHYLDASEEPQDHGFRLRITKGDPSQGDWALFRMAELPAEGIVSFESVRLAGHLLDATCDRSGLLDKRRKIRISEGDPTETWAQFRVRRLNGDNLYTLESVRLPGHYLDATEDSKLRVTQGDPSQEWAHFRLHDYIVSVERNISASTVEIGARPPSQLCARLHGVLRSQLWLWTALAISFNCFVTSGISFLWQNTVQNIWNFDNAESFSAFLLSTGVGGLLGVILGPKFFDGRLGGFQDPTGKALCLLWCKRFMLIAAISGTLCAGVLLCKAYCLVHYNIVTVVYPELFALMLGTFIIFVFINAITGTLYGVNTDAVNVELRTFAAGLTVSFQNVFGFACGPLIPSAFASIVSVSVGRIWPEFDWNPAAVDGAQFAAGMGLALLATWTLVLFTRQAAVRARLMAIRRNSSGNVHRPSLNAVGLPVL
eukprot:TRINITY_DN7907_c0_g1_i2.p1 TRINITY_DN7907_c0_g1~~TRINITY_DN7907_c0_g1_i2.p1  ORF type:complete len:562 (-),score=108.96 TRINITY_DN7907_c0_g1_i2:167-1852(-)